MSKKVYNMTVEGMTCANCALSIEKRLEKMPGLSDIRVNSVQNYAHFEAEDSVNPLDVVKEIEDLGYSVPLKTVNLTIGGLT